MAISTSVRTAQNPTPGSGKRDFFPILKRPYKNVNAIGSSPDDTEAKVAHPRKLQSKARRGYADID